MNKKQIDTFIEEIRNESKTHTIAPENLTKINPLDPEDSEFLSYINGTGGIYLVFLSLLVKKMNAKTVVELGNRRGLSTLSMYDQLPAESTFTTIDIIEDVRYCPDSMFTDPRVSFLFGDVCDIDVLRKTPFDIDLLYTDTIHHYFQIKDEFEIYQHLLADTALVAIDDINVNDKGRFWDELTCEKWDLTELCHHSGWGLFLFERKTSESKEERWGKAVEASSKIWQRKYTELQIEKDAALEKSVHNRARTFLHSHPKLHAVTLNLKKLWAR